MWGYNIYIYVCICMNIYICIYISTYFYNPYIGMMEYMMDIYMGVSINGVLKMDGL